MEFSETATTTYTPEAQVAARKAEESRLVHEGTEIWKAKKEESMRQKLREQYELRRMLSNYWPWGRPGGGAPCASALRKRNVPLEPREQPFNQTWRTRSLRDRSNCSGLYRSTYHNAYDAYNRCELEQFDRRVPENPETKEKHNDDCRMHQVYQLTGGVELAPLLRQWSPVDATRPGFMIDSWRASSRATASQRRYMDELAEQMRRKRELATQETAREDASSRCHFDTWHRLWGRPGHGAPTVDHGPRRNNLHDILYRPAMLMH
ncbi:uncharacterized protein LOC131664260 [Phymastichus coffea]|uniref:uncharacterized protein LOC131664260 n=1 Tax=Phymastichus coffea TaxID=108790 RepID=UPI00273B9FAC|nr:uncharacterized protein LOC131664260 [Phymastichus coffea]